VSHYPANAPTTDPTILLIPVENHPPALSLIIKAAVTTAHDPFKKKQKKKLMKIRNISSSVSVV
jgi:hypothetical protein